MRSPTRGARTSGQLAVVAARPTAAAATGAEAAWLFPSAFAGQPISFDTAAWHRRQLTLPLGEAGVATIRQLVQQAPAPRAPPSRFTAAAAP